MWAELDRRQQALLNHLGDHAGLCRRTAPDRGVVAASRWRIAQAARVRMDYLLGTAIPAAEAQATPDERARIVALRDGTPAYQRTISAYLARWPIESIMARWPVYVEEADRFHAIVVARIAAETAVLRAPLRRMAAPAAQRPVPQPMSIGAR